MGSKSFDDFKIIAAKVPHIESSQAYKIESEGKTLVYSGDTDFSESLINLSHEADVLLIECALATESLKMKGHLTPKVVIKTVNEANPRKVIVTHLYQDCDREKVVETIRINVDSEVLEARYFLEIET